jgi:tyrosyl-tRNA synthetase
MSLFEEFQWRDMIYDATPGLDDVLRREKVAGYIGFDPTADSLHVGSLLPLMVLARLQKFGHTPIAIAGGGTGLIGDPSGKIDERQLLSYEAVEENLEGIKTQLRHFLDFDGQNAAIMVNNAEWLTSLKLTEFLRDVGKYFSVNSMIAKESVKRRLQQQEGISFTEFSYMLLQAYDFLVMHDRYNCILQLGGSDQWGNIVAGIDLIRRMRGQQAYGLVVPLVTTSSGTKFGKTEAGTVWLDPKRTSPYHFYQFWLNTDDRDAITYLKFFTWLTQNGIAELESVVKKAPEGREAQRALAREVTRLTHSQEALESAERISQLFFSEEVGKLSAQEVLEVVSDAPSSEISASRLAGEGIELDELLHLAGLASSKGDARRAIKGGGIYLKNRRIIDTYYKATLNDSIDGKLFLLRKGKKQYHVVRILK